MDHDVTISLYELLDLVNCRFTYRHSNQVFCCSIAKWTGPVSDDEIRGYTEQAFMSPEGRSQGYGPEDRDNAIRRLTEWRDEYATESQLSGKG